MKSLLILLLPVLSLSLAAAESPPSIILINIDDLGYADMSPFGGKVPTPHLDRMAKEGMKLSCHYAAPVCSPSRASMMTGCYPKRVLPIPGVLFPVGAVGLNPQETTLAEVLKSAGYDTACIGKWHLGDQPEFLPLNQGFDHYFGIPYSNDMGLASEGSKSNPGSPLPSAPQKAAAKLVADETGLKGFSQPPLPLIDDHRVVERVKAAQQQTFTRRYTERAARYIREHQQRPYFLYLAHNAVHFPHYPHQDFMGKSGVSLQKDWCMEVDDSVGQVLDTLRTLKASANTLVIFTSDNGGPLNQGADNSPFRGGKGTTLEGGMRVCTIAWWPGKIAEGSETKAITAHMDWLPTFAALAHSPAPTTRKIDGIDISPILLGQKDAVGHEALYYYHGYHLQAVRSGSWKLHLGKNELFNLDDDLGEIHNLAKQQPQIVQKLKQLAKVMLEDLGDKTKDAPGVRPLGRVENPQPLIAPDGTMRTGLDRRAP